MHTKPQLPRAILVSFSGMDGAGKSTQILRLCARLEGAGLRVTLLAFWDHIARLKRVREASSQTLFGSEQGVGTPDAPVNRRDKNVRSWPMTGVRLCLYTIDALSLRRAVNHASRSGARVVVLDRYIYDEFANLNLGNPLLRMYVRLAMTLVPKPQVSYLLDADPVTARARKPEYPVEFLTACRASYLRLTKLVSGITVIAPQPVHAAELEILKAVQAELGLDLTSR